jgi:hypothetical protein
VTHDVAGAFTASLERSRTRRAAMANRISLLRRRRRRSSTASAAILGAVLALGAPLAVGQTTAQAPSSALVQQGANGAAVSAVQRALGMKATGYFGPVTARAVRAFQRRKGLTVDGIVGPQTAAALGIRARGAVLRQSTSSSAPSAALARIAACESGGNPVAVSADGRYRGKYQFSRATWRALGGSGDPAAAPEAEQDRLAAKLYAQRGAAPWPVCGG